MITKDKIRKQAPKFYASNLCGEVVKQWYFGVQSEIKGHLVSVRTTKIKIYG